MPPPGKGHALLLTHSKIAQENRQTAETSVASEIQYALDLRKPDLRKNLDLRKIVATTDFLVHKLFDLRKIF